MLARTTVRRHQVRHTHLALPHLHRHLVVFATGGGHEEVEEFRRPKVEEDDRRRRRNPHLLKGGGAAHAEVIVLPSPPPFYSRRRFAIVVAVLTSASAVFRVVVGSMCPQLFSYRVVVWILFDTRLRPLQWPLLRQSGVPLLQSAIAVVYPPCHSLCR